MRTVFAVLVVAGSLLGGAAGYFYIYQGGLTVYVRDATGPWAHVYVTFSDVQVHEAGKGNNSGWDTVRMQTKTVDLASLTTVSDLLAIDRLNPGKYTDIRIVVASASGQLSTGQAVNLTVPSGELKINHPFEISSARTTTLTVEIDLSRSIGQNGTGYVFTPVVGSVITG